MITRNELNNFFTDVDLVLIEKNEIYQILLKKNLKLVTIVKLNPNNKNEMVVSYYEDNEFVYDIITEDDVLLLESYDKIKERNNTLVKIFKK